MKLIVVAAVVVAVAVMGWELSRPPRQIDFSAQIIAPGAEIPNLGFRLVAPAYRWAFPADDQPHLEYQRERWTLDLAGCYGTPASISFERIGLIASSLAPRRTSNWSMTGVIIASLNLPEAARTRYSRQALGLAGSESGHIWLDDWSLSWDGRTYTVEGALKGNFTVASARQTAIYDTYYEVMYNLTGSAANTGCAATLSHVFGQSLP